MAGTAPRGVGHPTIHFFFQPPQDVDGRASSGHGEAWRFLKQEIHA